MRARGVGMTGFTMASELAGSAKPPVYPSPGPWGRIAYILLGLQTLLGLVAVGAVWWGISSTFVHMQNDISNSQIEIAKIEAQMARDRTDIQSQIAADRASTQANQASINQQLLIISTTLARVDAQLGDIKSGHR